MATVSDIVSGTYTNSQKYAESAQKQLDGFTKALSAAIHKPPTVSYSWRTPPIGSVRTIPDLPVLPDIQFEQGNLADKPRGESESPPPEITVDPFTEQAPTLSFPSAPTMSFGSVPQVPPLVLPEFPDAPKLDSPASPRFLTINTPTFAGVSLPSGAGLDEIPQLDLVQPTPYQYIAGNEYASQLLEKLKAVLERRLNGGSGLLPEVEQALWDRARGREVGVAKGKLREHQRLAEASGFVLPSGALLAGLQQVRKEYYDGLSTLSREVSIQQAQLEQQNLKDTIAAGMQLEGQLIDYSYKLEQLTFEHAKSAADNAVQLYNSGVQAYQALLQAYQTRASVFKARIDGQLAAVEVFKAQVQAELAKAEVNKNLVAQYRAQIDANMSLVEIYKAMMGGAQVQIQAEQARMGAIGEQIRAFVARSNAEVAKMEGFKARVQGEAAKMEGFKAKATAMAARMSAQAEVGRVNVARWQAIQVAKSAEWEGYRASMDAEKTRLAALGQQSNALVDGFRASTAAAVAEAESELAKWVASGRQYEASIQGMLQTAKINGDAVLAANNARLDAAKAGTQVYAQLTSSAYGMLNVSAGISASSGTTVGYSYGGEVSGDVYPLPMA